MKLAVDRVSAGLSWSNSELTVCGRVHDNEAGVDLGLGVPISPFHSVGVTAEPVGSLKDVDIMVSAVERPQCGDSRAAGANYGNPPPGDAVSRRGHE
jgi:hypothetical protein